jgi:hypothetical protein
MLQQLLRLTLMNVNELLAVAAAAVGNFSDFK